MQGQLVETGLGLVGTQRRFEILLEAGDVVEESLELLAQLLSLSNRFLIFLEIFEVASERVNDQV